MANVATERPDDEVSFFALGALLLRDRWRIGRWALIGALVMLPGAIMKRATYGAYASFVPQGATEAGRGGLATLAGQFGLALPTGGQALSPDFYAGLLKSRVLLLPIVHDSFVVAEMKGRRLAFTDLFEIQGDPAWREEQGLKILQGIVGTSVVRTTGVVEISVATPWRSVSLAIVDTLLHGIDEYNQRTRQSQAASERRFVEGRLAVATGELREAEDRLGEFLRANRGGFALSPELAKVHDRLQRVVLMKQQIYTSLAQSYEEARIREVRDNPLIAVVEPAYAPMLPQPRGRVKRVALGVAAGGMIGMFVAFAAAAFRRRRRLGDPEAAAFAAALRDVKGDFFGRGPRAESHMPPRAR